MRVSLFIGLNFFASLFYAQDSLEKKSRRFTLHAQETTVSQYRQKFNAFYTGERELQADADFAGCGLGFVIGDGKLNYSNKHVLEPYYSASLVNNDITSSLVYQFIANPAYNKDRGPMHVYSVRMHFTI